MREKKFVKKLVLNKNTVSSLNESGMMAIQAGSGVTDCIATCPTDRNCRTNEQQYCPSVQGCGTWDYPKCESEDGCPPPQE